MPNNRADDALPIHPRRIRGLLTTIMVVFIANLVACDRNIEPYQPGEEASQPDLARIFPGAAGESGPQGQAVANAASGMPTRGAVPPSRAEGSQSDDSASDSAGNAAGSATGAAPIEGRIELAPDVGSGPAGAVLFVIARPHGAQGGPPLAVLRIANATFPLDFSIGPANVMIPSMRFEGAISLSARLDVDGNAMTRGAGDLASPVEEPLSPGTTGVRLVLGQGG